MKTFSTETAAFKAGGDMVAALCREGKPNFGFRVLPHEGRFKVLMVPERMKWMSSVLPFYL